VLTQRPNRGDTSWEIEQYLEEPATVWMCIWQIDKNLGNCKTTDFPRPVCENDITKVTPSNCLPDINQSLDTASA
jgi:hypothetical protein